MEDREPTIRARRLDWEDSTVSRLLSGKRGGDPVEVATFMGVCNTPRDERERLLGLCEGRSTPGWLQQYGDRLPKQVQTLVTHEDKAVSIGHFQMVVVHGLLQTEDYARALISGQADLSVAEVEDRVRARMDRKCLFSKEHRPQFSFLLEEFVLWRCVGSTEIMSEQLHHLLRMSVRPYISLRVVPAGVGVHAGLAGPFTLLDFNEVRPVVYLDSETSCLFLETHQEIASYRRVLGKLAVVALDEPQSRELIAAAATDRYT
ncbi:DUF5753 domain-containing protein [Amycolatopsis nigrescens]|uniref:DUF5753 domain-containing protein n=1 Tax=Amycolatopsis nigrescens TaxID=381445 RepID=UPI000365EA45|nr:DUF5753 domain-containing protein [Amycolatopsis nigrescens]